MGTTAVKLWFIAGVLLGAGSCAPASTPEEPPRPPAPEPPREPRPASRSEPRPQPQPQPEPEPRRDPVAIGPEIRIGLATRFPNVTIGGGAPLLVTEPDGAIVVRVPAGQVWRIVPTRGGLSIGSATGPLLGPFDALVWTPDSFGDADAMRINGRAYRGVGEALRDTAGVTVVNRLPMEQYLLSVVSSEMGRRGPGEEAALEAQAVVSRTYAMRNLRRWRAQGFDLYASVADQVYGGVDTETPQGNAAVRATRGQVLTFDRAPIDAFFYSTCGGRTAQGVEIFRNATHSYLQSVSDAAPDGASYCRISPRYHWREEWTGAAILATLRRTLPTVLGITTERVRDLRGLRVAGRTGSGRVEQLAIGLGRSEVQVPGRQVRQVLRTPSGEGLRSTAFTLTVSGAGRSVTKVVAEGGGAGHGVGLCQWGAIGRARAGHRYDQILAAYYQGTTLERLY